MKTNRKIMLIIATIIFNLNVYSQDYSTAGGYMSYIGEDSKKISKDMWDYMSAIARGKNARKVENRRKDLLKTIMTAKTKISAAKDYKGDYSLRDSAVAFLQFNYDLLNKDYEKIINMEEISEKSYD